MDKVAPELRQRLGLSKDVCIRYIPNLGDLTTAEEATFRTNWEDLFRLRSSDDLGKHIFECGYHALCIGGKDLKKPCAMYVSYMDRPLVECTKSGKKSNKKSPLYLDADPRSNGTPISADESDPFFSALIAVKEKYRRKGVRKLLYELQEALHVWSGYGTPKKIGMKTKDSPGWLLDSFIKFGYTVVGNPDEKVADSRIKLTWDDFSPRCQWLWKMFDPDAFRVEDGSFLSDRYLGLVHRGYVEDHDSQVESQGSAAGAECAAPENSPDVTNAEIPSGESASSALAASSDDKSNETSETPTAGNQSADVSGECAGDDTVMTDTTDDVEPANVSQVRAFLSES